MKILKKFYIYKKKVEIPVTEMATSATPTAEQAVHVSSSLERTVTVATKSKGAENVLEIDLSSIFLKFSFN